MIGPNAQAMLDFARPGDTIVVWRLDRLGRSLKHLIETVMGLQARGINFWSLTEHVLEVRGPRRSGCALNGQEGKKTEEDRGTRK
jgi:hypothetical protein